MTLLRSFVWHPLAYIGAMVAVLSLVNVPSSFAAPPPGSYLPGQLLVKVKPAPPGLAQKAPAHLAGTRVQANYTRLGWQKLRLPLGQSVPEAIEYYRRQPEVMEVEPNYRIQLFATPNDPSRSSLWGLDKINVAEAWSLTTGSTGVVVAVLDSGIDYTHPDLAANVWTNPNEIPGNNVDDDHDGYVDDIHGINLVNNTSDVRDDDGHGTHVAGTIGAVGNNGIGVVGVNWRVTVLPIKIFSADDSSGTAGAVEAYEYLIALKQRGVNIRVVNNSWGGAFPSHALYEAICAAETNGILSVCSAGNSGYNNDERPQFPASIDCPSLISVAASTRNDELAFFSNFGAKTIDLVAPGQSVLSTYRGAHYLEESGTSMASPHVAGAAALLLAQDSSLTPAALKGLLLATVDVLPPLHGRVASAGRLNVGRAMTQLISGPLPPSTPATNDAAQFWPRLTGLSRNAVGAWGDAPSYEAAISSNGQFVAFLSEASNLTNGVSGGHVLVYLRDRATGAIALISRSSSGGLPNGDCRDLRMSADGRYAVFASTANNLVPNDGNNASDVFLYDRDSGQTELISTVGGFSANGASDSPAVNADGRFVVFVSGANNLVPGDTNGYRDIFLRDRQLGTTTRASVSSTGIPGHYPSEAPCISADGRYIAFASVADNLVAEVWNRSYQLYLRDRVANTTVRLSKNASGLPGNTNCGRSTISADGRYIAFESRASNLVTGDTNNQQDIFLRDRVTGVTQRVSVGNNGAQSDQPCWEPSISANGRYIYFFSATGNLFPQDDNPAYDVFAYDRLFGKLGRLSYNSAGHEAIDSSLFPAASGDGRFVVFDSYAWNLVPGDGNGSRDVFLLDRGAVLPDLSIYAGSETNRRGLGLYGTNILQRRELLLTNNPTSFLIRLDNDGVTNETFWVRANAAPAGWAAQFFRGTTNITAAVTGAGWTVPLAPATNVVLRLEVSSVNAAVGESLAQWIITASATRSNAASDAVRAVIRRTASPPALQVISRAPDGHLGNDLSPAADLNADGRFITFTSLSSDLTNYDFNFREDVFVLDRQTGALECLSKQANGTNGNGRSTNSRLTRDGRYVIFQSSATNLVANDTNEHTDVFLYDRQNRTTSLVSVGPNGLRSGRDSGSAHISNDGRYVVFESLADNFVAGDTNNTWDVFWRDLTTGNVQCLSLAGAVPANDESRSAAVSVDGSLVVFRSLASNLVPNDTNNTFDLFLWERGVNGVQLLSRTADGRSANGPSGSPSISDDNRFILFTSMASDLAVPVYDAESTLFLYDRQTSQLSQLHPPRLTGRQRGPFSGAHLAPDGRLITLQAEVTDAPGSNHFVMGVFLYDRISGALTELSRNRDGTAGSGHSLGARVSGDGRYIVFSSRAPNLLIEANPGIDQMLLYDNASFQPDEWIRRGSNAPNRGQDVFVDSGQRVELTIAFNATNIFFLTIRNHGTAADQFIFKAPAYITNVLGGIKARYFIQPAGTEITTMATNKGWTSDLVAVGGTREIRVQITASPTNLFNQDLVFTSTSVTDPTKVDVVRLRLVRDDDRDGLPNTWEQQYFGNPTNALASADGDGDGFSNMAEYIGSTNPTNSASYFRISNIMANGHSSVTVTWLGATNRFYVVERATGAPIGFTNVAGLYGTGSETVYFDFWPTNPPPSFYRIRAELP